MQDTSPPSNSASSSPSSGAPESNQKVRLLGKGTVRWLLAVVGFVVGLDQVSKALILDSFESGEIKEIIPGLFNLTLHYNPGVAFGMFADLEDGARILVLTFTTVLALALVFYFLVTEYRYDRSGQFALALVLGGAVGNIIDRVRLGKVVDFLDFYLGTAHWPAFNVADSAICVGVSILLFKSLFHPVPPAESR
jgi:signal peptidase II